MRCAAILLILSLILGCAAPETAYFNKSYLYEKITLDIVCVSGNAPNANSLEFFENKLRQYHLTKQLIVNLRSVPVKSTNNVWNMASLQMFEAEHKSIQKSDNPSELVVFVSFLPGSYIQGKTKDLSGIQYFGNSFAVFKQRVYESEGIIMVHEFSHILSIGSNKNSPDREPINPERPNHCNNQHCIMYWTVNSEVTDFDGNCRREIANLLPN